MANDIQLFNYGENPVRTVIKDGQVWFVAKDVCDILEIKNARDAISNLDDDEKNTVAFSDGNRGNPNVNIINESGLYTLILRSNKKEAKKFRKWVTSEVLPALMRTGKYEVPNRKQDTQPEQVQEQEESKLNYTSQGIMNSVRKIVEHALNDKTGKDFQVTLAMDRAFQAIHGCSALELAGFSLKEKIDSVYHEGEFSYYRNNFGFEWVHNLPELPSDDAAISSYRISTFKEAERLAEIERELRSFNGNVGF